MSKVQKSRNSNINMKKHVEKLSGDRTNTVASGKELGVRKSKAGNCCFPL